MGIINLFLTRKNVFFLAILLLFCFLQDLVVRLFWNTLVSLSIGDSIILRFFCFFLQKLHWLWYLKIFLCVICWRYFLFFIIVWYRLFSSDLVCGLWEIKFKNYFGLQPWISENYVFFFFINCKVSMLFNGNLSDSLSPHCSLLLAILFLYKQMFCLLFNNWNAVLGVDQS